MALRVTFDSSARDFILEAFGKRVKDGLIVEKAPNGQKVITPRGEEVPIKQFAGVRKGSVIFVKSDIVSMVEVAEALK